MNILFIGAHPDDIELSAAGTMLKYRERGDNIFMIVTTTGNIGSGVIDSKEKIAEIRANEAREAAKIAEPKFTSFRLTTNCLSTTKLLATRC